VADVGLLFVEISTYI